MYYSEDLRQKAVEYLQKGHTQKEASEVFGVSRTALKRWKKQYLETGSLKNKPLNRKHKKIDPKILSDYVSEHPDAYLKEIAEVFGCTGEAIRLALKKLHITSKKTKVYQERSEGKRSEFIEKLMEIPRDSIIYVGKTGIDQFLYRECARSYRGKRYMESLAERSINVPVLCCAM